MPRIPLRHTRPDQVRIAEHFHRSTRTDGRRRHARTLPSPTGGVAPGSTATAHRRRVIAGILAGALLCSAATIVLVILGTRLTTETGDRTPTAATPIDGIAALRPDLLRQAQWPYANGDGLPQLNDADKRPAEPVTRDEPAWHHVANPAAGSAASAKRTAQRFYHLLDTDPSHAVRMLDPPLTRAQHAAVADAWAAVTSVHLNTVRVLPNGHVLTEVAARYPDGTRVTSRQLLSVGSGTTPRITNAHLLDARRSTPRHTDW